MKIVRIGPIVAACVCALLLSASQGGATVIDHFQDVFSPTADLTVNSGSTTATDTTSPITNGLAGVTTRKTDLKFLGGAGSLSADAQVILAPHFLAYSNKATVTSTLTLTYTFSVVEDLSGDTHFVLLTGSDLGGVSKLFVQDTGANSFESSNVVAVGPGVLAIPFSDFTSAGVQMDKVNEVRLTIDGPAAFDATIDALDTGTVPEPLTMLGMFLGLGSVGAYIRKRRMS